MILKFYLRVTGTGITPRRNEGVPSRASLGKECAELPIGCLGEDIQ